MFNFLALQLFIFIGKLFSLFQTLSQKSQMLPIIFYQVCVISDNLTDYWSDVRVMCCESGGTWTCTCSTEKASVKVS